MIFLNTRKNRAECHWWEGLQRWATVNPCSYCVFTVHLKSQLRPFRKWLLQDKSRLARVQMDRYNCAEHWKTEVSIQFGHFFSFWLPKCFLQQRLVFEGEQASPRTTANTNPANYCQDKCTNPGAHTHDNTEEENVWCSCVGWILNKHILSFPASSQYVAVLMSSSLDELIQGHKKIK